MPSPGSLAAKRMFDLVVAMIGLAVLLPIMVVTGLAVWVSSGRPIFFRHQRVGRGGRGFMVFKFRTMTIGHESENGSFDAGSLARVTLIGRFLRKWKLDELPQLWNVLIGDMSLVGPRPEVRRWVEAYPERWRNVLSLRPGITDLASITFRNEEELLAKSQDPERYYGEVILPHKLDLYERYEQSRSFWGDIGILWKTFLVVVCGR